MDKYIGKLLDGRYEILEIIGVGGMAVVYRARCRILNRFVAIKILKDEYAQNEEFRRRFYIESQAVAKLSHNNIVSVFDVSHTQGLDYIVMELIEGVTLKEHLERRGCLHWQETLFFAQQIARALSHAHSRGIIHQDIKPQNVIILQDGTAKVTDFGIASFAGTQETRVIQEAIGSVHYISPEQAKGSRIDFRADLYSLGVVMYEMLTGKLPFVGDTPLAVVMQHLNAVPLLPSEVVEGVPQGMDQIVMHAMCPALTQRYRTAEELIQDLSQLQNDPGTLFSYSCAELRSDTTAFGMTQAMPSYDDIRRQDDMRQTGQRPVPRTAPKRPVKKGFFARMSESPTRLAGFVVACIAVAALVIMGILLIGGGSSGKKYEVPNFVGQNIDEVLNGQYQGAFSLKRGEDVTSDQYPVGTIVTQSVQAGDKVASGTEIEFSVSTGSSTSDETTNSDSIILADYSGQKQSAAEDALKALGLSTTVKEENSDTVDEGYVIRTDPTESSTITKADTVTIYVSSGPASVTTAQMPDVIGQQVTDAEKTLSAYGITLGKKRIVESSEPEGTVVTQSIKAGTEVNEGDSVTLEVSSGVAPSDDNTSTGDDSTNTSSGSGSSSTTTGSATLSVAIPEDSQSTSAHIVVKLDDGTVAYDQTVNSPGTLVTVPLKGSGTRLATAYVNGTQVGSPTQVIFN